MKSRAIILCAGEARRLGRAKALLEFGGVSFLARAVAALAGGGVDEICVVVGGGYAHSLRQAVAALPRAECGVSVVESRDVASGPIGSIQSGVAAPGAKSIDLFLVHPVDIPGVSAADVSALLAAAHNAPQADAIIPSVDMRRGHPVLLRRSLALSAETLPRGQTLRDLLHRAETRIHFVERSNHWLCFDVDTEEDYRTFCSGYGRSPS